MGKIMMNGIQYGVGGIEQAKDISYDNTESGATATDVQGALDELNASLTFNIANAYSGYPNTIHHCYEHAGIVHLNFRVQFPIQATHSWLVVAYLPQGYTEVATEVYMPVAILLGSSSIITTLGAIRNGGVEVFNSAELVAVRGSYANAIAYYDTSYAVSQ